MADETINPGNAALEEQRRGDPENRSGSRARPISREKRALREGAELGIPLRTKAEEKRFYAAMVKELTTKYKISIRKWRRHMSGVAYELKFGDGRIKRLITAPRPRSVVSAAIFLHEVGHHAIGFKRYSPRCLEEYYVWQWTFREMVARGIPVDARVMRHYRRSMHHYVRMEMMAGSHRVPAELHQFVH